MARINGKNKISGAIGAVVFRTFNGKQIIQSKGRKITQSQATRSSAREFRQCSTWAKGLRLSYESFLAAMTDSYMHGRLTAALYQTLRHNTTLLPGSRTPFTSDMSGLAGFEMNTNSPFAAYFLPEITVVFTAGGEVAVHCDGFVAKDAVTFPEGLVHAELLLYVMTTNLAQAAPVAAQHWLIPFALGDVVPAIDWLTAPLPADGLTTVAAKLLYYRDNTLTGKTYCNTKMLSPARILAVVNNVSG